MIAIRIAIVVLVVVAIEASTAAQKPAPIIGETLRAIETWVQAVRSHTPGSEDGALKAVIGLTYDDRVQLDAGITLFLDALLGRRYNTGGSPAGKAIVASGHAAGVPDATGFLKRAAILHADAAGRGGPPDAPMDQRKSPGTGRPPRVSPLLENTPLPLTRDGEIISETTATWHLPFARFLLDHLGTPKQPDPFVAAWYHATNAELFSRAAYGDLTTHLDRAERILPSDPWVLFDRACYAEVLGLPLLQAVVSERDESIERLNNRGGPPTWRPPVTPTTTRIPAATETNAEAERLYRRALQADPSLVEARVRLARLLDSRGRHQEAAAELNAAAATPAAGIVGYYTHLFSGRTSQSLGRLADATHHYQSALALFPHAQSALLAASQLALISADVPSALGPIERLGERSAEPDADPWWLYYLCAGRDAEMLRRRLWAGVPR